MFPTEEEVKRHSETNHVKSLNRCKFCSKQCHTKSYLRRHLKTHLDEMKSLISCSKCEDVFESEEAMSRHICNSSRKTVHCEFCLHLSDTDKQHHRHVNREHLDRIGDTWHRCKDCCVFFQSESDLNCHNCVGDRQELECPYCDSVFSAQDSLNQHIKKKHPRGADDAIIECSLCSRQFDSDESLNIHVNERHEGSKDQIWPPCKLCSAHFSCQTQFKTHICSKRLKCKHCDSSYLHNESLHKHILAMHSDVSKIGINCNFCSKRLLNGQMYTAHVNKEHLNKIENIWLRCKQCLRYVPSKLMLEKHGCKKRLKCSKCNARFSRTRLLKEHLILNHSLEVAIKCNVCFKKFFSEKELTFHTDKAHSAKTLHQCKTCLSQFPSEKKVKEHRCNIKCSKCSRDFGRVNHLKRHVERHHPESLECSIECSFCEKQFHKSRSHIYFIHARYDIFFFFSFFLSFILFFKRFLSLLLSMSLHRKG